MNKNPATDGASTNPLPPCLQLITIQGLARAWSAPEDTLRAWYRQGKLPGYKIGDKILIRVDKLREMFEA